jgi:hypothetical protein
VLGNASQHPRPNFIFIMKLEDDIGPTRSRKDLVRAGFALDSPADTNERGENSLWLLSTDSSRSKGDIHKFRRGFYMLKAVGQRSQS